MRLHSFILYRGLMLAFVAALAGLTGCGFAMLNVQSDFDRTVSFQPYRTFGFYEAGANLQLNGETPQYNTSIDEQLKAAIASELVIKGLTPAIDEAPDLLIAYDIAIATDPESQNNVVVPGYGYGYSYWYGYRFNYDFAGLPTYRSISEYQVGTLVIDFINPGLNALVWRGWADGGITVTDTDQKRLNRAVSSIMAQYPPG
ncbi:DUF4136 domain-containing protein [Pontibacter qinzhouensis]|uniref:DUF4136 domain-containing protein n=1 Tax=Pontibacter qinzhouensis TaxID=2603253 RepID=A0A5C8JJ84_9BACT|nr:DUF4136 domain-containing protein [Pontibacter qinzhouensis]TXK37799.1 DUF4136 domain-containing protein [Pontibacter qinzhouensis]